MCIINLCCPHRLKDFAEAYEIIKTERNKTHTLIQTMTQVGQYLIVHEKYSSLALPSLPVGCRAEGKGKDLTE